MNSKTNAPKGAIRSFSISKTHRGRFLMDGQVVPVSKIPGYNYEDNRNWYFVGYVSSNPEDGTVMYHQPPKPTPALDRVMTEMGRSWDNPDPGPQPLPISLRGEIVYMCPEIIDDEKDDEEQAPRSQKRFWDNVPRALRTASIATG